MYSVIAKQELGTVHHLSSAPIIFMLITRFPKHKSELSGFWPWAKPMMFGVLSMRVSFSPSKLTSVKTHSCQSFCLPSKCSYFEEELVEHYSTISLYFAVTFPAASEIPLLYFAEASAVISKACVVLRDDEFETVLTVLSAVRDSTNTHSTLMAVTVKWFWQPGNILLERHSLTSAGL